MGNHLTYVVLGPEITPLEGLINFHHLEDFFLGILNGFESFNKLTDLTTCTSNLHRLLTDVHDLFGFTAKADIGDFLKAA